MSTKTGGLKKTAGKGAVPKRGAGVDPIAADTRPAAGTGSKKPLQFMVTEEMFEEFGQQAADMFGHSKGAKTQYFKYLMGLAKK